jgi:hypothetical protein
MFVGLAHELLLLRLGPLVILGELRALPIKVLRCCSLLLLHVLLLLLLGLLGSELVVWGVVWLVGSLIVLLMGLLLHLHLV